MRVCVVGLGKIGVPLAVQFASKGADVVGYDINPARVAEINEGRNPLPEEPGIDRLSALVESGALLATADPADAAAGADVVVFIVPVDIDAAHHPDFRMLDAAVAAVARHIKRGALVIVETTVPVGTTRDRVGALIEKISALAPGEGFALAFSPERVSSGTVLRDLATYPKIIGGIDDASSQRAADFYRSMLDAEVTIVSDAETAEFSKLAETTYRDVNIALANEFARIADGQGVDVGEAIVAANSQPYSHIHAPGPGVGGHCIPVYPYFLGAEDAGLIQTARRINDGMAAYSVQNLSDAMDGLEGKTVVVLGLSYRAGVKESRHSSAFGIVEALADAGATAYVHDPLYTHEEIRYARLDPPPSFPLPVDALVVQAWHAAYTSLDFGNFQGLRVILDARAVLDPAVVRKAGLKYIGIGRP